MRVTKEPTLLVPEDLKCTLDKHGQAHLLDHWDDPEVTDQDRRALMAQLRSIDFEEMTLAFREATREPSSLGKIKDNGNGSPVSLRPVRPEICASVNETSEDEMARFRTIGLTAVKAGEVGVLLLAGGQGTRLGVQYPKGMYDIGLPSGKSLFQVQAERLLRLQELAGGRTIPLYLMTSSHTRAQTEAFFLKHRFFGLREQDLVFFEQRTIPCFDCQGKMILQSKAGGGHLLAMAPDGNGGLYWALQNRNILQDMLDRGVKYLHIYCVDNVLARVADPVFVGFCISRRADAGNKVVEKLDPDEAVGVVVRGVDGGTNVGHRVVEYSEIGPDRAKLRDSSSGKLLFRAGNICNHFFTVDFLAKVCRMGPSGLPFHVARKMIPSSVGPGVKAAAAVPGIKLERFVFDVFPHAANLVVWECNRPEEFSPLKNADPPGQGPLVSEGTPRAARNDLFRLHRKFIEDAGGRVAASERDDAVVACEVSPLLSYAGEGLEGCVQGRVFSDTPVVLEPVRPTRSPLKSHL